MNSLQRKTVLISLVIGTALAGAACNQRSPSTASTTGSTNPPSTASQTTTPPSQTAMAPSTSSSPTTSNKMAGAVDDASITAQVKSAITAEPGLKATSINVDTKDAVVTLSGSVPSAQLKDRAKEIASNVAGVKSVENNLTTSSSG